MESSNSENKINESKIKEYLTKYRDASTQFINSQAINFLEKNHLFYQDFFKKENLEKATWADFQKLGDYIHSFNSIQLAKSRALGTMNHTIEHYRKVFIYLCYAEDEINVKINNVLEKGGEYYLFGFGKSVISELVGYAFSDKYVFFNARDREAIDFLGIKPNYQRGDKFGDKFKKYNDSIEELKFLYQEIVGKKTQFPLTFEID